MPPGFIPGSLLSDREIPDHHQIMLDALGSGSASPAPRSPTASTGC